MKDFIVEVYNNWSDYKYRFWFKTEIISYITTKNNFVKIFSTVLFIPFLFITQRTLNVLNFDGYSFGDITYNFIRLLTSNNINNIFVDYLNKLDVSKLTDIKKSLWVNIYNQNTTGYKSLYFYSLFVLVFGSVGLTTWFYNMYLKVLKDEGFFDSEIHVSPEHIIEPILEYKESLLHEKHESGIKIGAMPSVVLGNKHYQYKIGKLKIKPDLIRLGWEGLRTHTLVTGTIGTGKTQFALYPITLQLLSFRPDDKDKKLGALILDVKGDYYKKVLDFTKSVGRLEDVRIIELGGKYKYNPLHKPDMLASELASRVIEIARSRDGNRVGNDAFWENQGKAFIENSIRLARLHSNYVSFKIIDRIIRLQKHNELLEEIRIRYNQGLLSDDEIYTFNKLEDYFSIEIDQGREETAKIIRIVEQTIQPMINSFLSEKEIEDTFTPDIEDLNFLGFDEMINKGLIVVLKMDNATYPDLAPFIASYLALDFQKTTLQRIKKDTNLNVTRPLAFICDEVHFMMTQSWGEWLSVARQSNTAGIFATQSYQSLIEKMDEKIVYSIIQNINNKIWLRSEDKNTIDDVVRTAGKYEKVKETISINETTLKGAIDLTAGSIKGKNANVGLNTSFSFEEKDRIRFDEFKNDMPDFTAFVSIATERTDKREYEKGSKFNTLVYLNHWSKYGDIIPLSEEEELLLLKGIDLSPDTINSSIDNIGNDDNVVDIIIRDIANAPINEKENEIAINKEINIKDKHIENKIQEIDKEKEERENNKTSNIISIIDDDINIANDIVDILEDNLQDLEIINSDTDSKESDIKAKDNDADIDTKDIIIDATTKVGTAIALKELEIAKNLDNGKEIVESINKVSEDLDKLNEKDWFDF